MLPRLTLLLPLCLAACGSDYSPDTYATRAVQQANRVERAAVIGVREVRVAADGATGAAAGAAVGGIAGAQAGTGITAALAGISGALVGGVFGSAVERASGDTAAFEYVVRKDNGELYSVTQRDPIALTIGQRVLMITGNQARLVADYTVPTEPAAPAPIAPPAAEPLPGSPAGLL